MTPVFVSRQAEKARLFAWLEQALAGQSQVAFVTGEAGEGKTTLAHNFAEAVLAQHPSVLIAYGNCSAQNGRGDPYLPFREVLSELTGLSASAEKEVKSSSGVQKVMARTAQILVDLGPDLVGTLIPGGRILAQIGKTVAQRVGWMDELEKIIKRKATAPNASIDQGRIFEQYANVLQALAKQQPLLLILDDLQWADEATISLLFHLSRRLGSSPVMILGTYRPEEVAALQGTNPHPLNKVLSEVKRYAGGVWINLGQEGEAQRRFFIDQLIDSEPNQLDAGFRQSLFELTGGHALFSVEVLRTLQEQGHLFKNPAGQWVASEALEWATLPTRVEGVIEERIARLEASQQDLLRTASVEGERFTAEVLAELQQQNLRDLYKQLSQNLEKVHRLVVEQPPVRAGRSRLAVYRFVHVLFRKFLYEQLGWGERSLLHEDVARSLERLYAEHLEEVYVPLAWHFEQAGNEAKAAEYTLLAGRHALKQGAPREAAGFFERALAWLGEADVEGRWQVALEQNTALVYLSDLNGWKANLQLLHGLAKASGDSARVAEIYNREANLALSGGQYSAGLLVADQAIAAAKLAGDVIQEALGHHWKILLYTRLGQFAAARQAAETALALARASGDEAVLMKTLRHIGILEMWAGFPERALPLQAESLELAQRLGDSRTEQATLQDQAISYAWLGLPQASEASLEQSLQIARRIGLVAVVVNGKLTRGSAELVEGKLDTAWHNFSEAHAELLKLRQPYYIGVALRYLGTVSERQGNLIQAMQHYQEGLRLFQSIGGNPPLELYCMAGLAQCALALGQGDRATQQASELWQQVLTHDPQSFAMPAEVYLACAKVFANDNPEAASAALERGYQALMVHAGQMDNPLWSEAFLHKIPEHRDLLEAWEAMRINHKV